MVPVIYKKIAHWLVLLVVAGCSPSEQTKANKIKSERIESARAIAAQPPQPKTYAINGNQLVVVEVSSADGRFVDKQKCFVWRDQEFKTSAISCPSEQATEVPGVLGESEKSGY